MALKLTEIVTYVEESLARAREAALEITFAEAEVKYARKANLNQINQFASLPTYSGVANWATVLFLDLRGSTKRAVENGPEKTYLTMHALLPTMAHLMTECGGAVCNFRGDGLFGVFGIDDDGKNPPDLDSKAGQFVQEAANCARAMLEALEGAVNKVLKTYNLPSDLEIGVGIDHGQVVITRIGLNSINELTVYGAPVNGAAKLCFGNGLILLSERAKSSYPKTAGGRITFRDYHRVRGRTDGSPPEGYQLICPAELKVLK